MVLPEVSLFPDNFDSDENLYLVHDSLRVRLLEDYNPGDTIITIEELDDSKPSFDRFPENGIITLTEQCSEDVKERAISFFYTSKGTNTFEGLSILSRFTDTLKPKRLTNVTQNVMDIHHNAIKDALIAIEEFVGVKGTIDATPLGDTMEGRINFLTQLVFTPRAWFAANKTIGLIPLTVKFTDQSFCTGDGEVIFIWDFGDSMCSTISSSSVTSAISVISGISTSSITTVISSGEMCPVISTISVTSVVPINQVDVLVRDLDGGMIEKTYSKPGNFDVSLRVVNEFGEDTVTFNNFINARVEAPDKAVIDFIPRAGQTTTDGSPDGGPFETPPTIRSLINTFIDIEIPEGTNPATGRSFGGEELVAGTPIDPITTYTWKLGDDLNHPNLPFTRASYSIGGIFDLKLRVDTELGAYRITTYEDSIDIIERKNLWLWVFDPSSINVKSNEFGLLSEVFKTSSTSLSIVRDNSFLDGTNNETQAKKEFDKNTGFSPRGTTPSGQQGTALMFWASGGASAAAIATQSVKISEYQGFIDTYTDPDGFPTTITRPWNWAFLANGQQAFFVFGPEPLALSNTNSSYQVKSTLDLLNFSVSETTLDISNYLNGANELQEHVTSGFDGSGEPDNGRFAVYRTAWKDSTGYIIRNDGVGTFFRLRSFYRTEGDISNPFTSIRKLPDMAGPTKLEGELVPLTNGVFFFNNTGSISAYNDNTGIWETGGPSSNSASFRSVQDTSVVGFDNPTNTLLATSDEDRIAYLSYDYSTNAFTKFNGQDLTFSNIGPRPSGTQFIMGIF